MTSPLAKEKYSAYLWFAFGLLAMAFSVWELYEVGYRYYVVPRTSATVLEIEVVERAMTGDEGGSYPVYIPVITREYSVDGARFTGRRFGSGHSQAFRHRPDAENVANRFKVGEKMTVFYDPREPKKSFVVNDLDWQRGAGFALLLLGGFAIVMLNRRNRRDAHEAETRIGFF
jgi:hypothetical protein